MLVGISDETLDNHIAAWAGQQDALVALRKQKVALLARAAKAPAPVDADTRALMQSRIADLDLKVDGVLAECVAEVEGELVSRGITWKPTWFIGTSGLVDGEFWTADRANSISLPWYLANEQLWREVNDPKVGYTKEDVLRVLRHEVGHALGYAFELWKRPDWKATFGDFEKKYDDAYTPRPDSKDFVRYLHDTGPSQNSHYAQKHPDEDWAETFAVWLDPSEEGWRQRYARWPGALAKLVYVDSLMNVSGAAYGDAPNAEKGKQESYKTEPGTVGDFVGGWAPSDLWSPAGEILRREASLATHEELHRLYFENLGAGSDSAKEDVLNALGDGWEAGFRAACAAASGWAVTVFHNGVGPVTYALPEGGSPPAGQQVLVVCDLFEHSYWSDFPSRKDLYVAAFLRNLDWYEVERRLMR